MSRIPGFYRIFFTWIDPLMAGVTGLQGFVAPAALLELQVADATLDPLYRPHFQQIGGYLLGMAFLSAALLRAAPALRVWKLFQASVLIHDASILSSTYAALEYQRRLSPADWRGLDWFCVVVASGVAALRLCFLMEVGFRGGARGVKQA